MGPLGLKSHPIFKGLSLPQLHNISTKSFLRANFLTASLIEGISQSLFDYPSQNWTTAQSNNHTVETIRMKRFKPLLHFNENKPPAWDNYRVTHSTCRQNAVPVSIGDHFHLAWKVPILSVSTWGQVIKRKGMALKYLSFYPILPASKYLYLLFIYKVCH